MFEIKALLYKELLIEWKQRYAIGSLLLFVFSAIFIVGLLIHNQLEPKLWNIIFWIIVFFVSINGVARSFLSESDGQILYLYTLCSPISLMLAKLLFNTLLMLFVALISHLFYALFLGFPSENRLLYIGIVALGGGSLGSTLTLLSAIASKSSNKLTMMAVISFPVLIPHLSMIIKLTQSAIFNTVQTNDILYLLSLTFIVITVSLLLFPYLWRD